METDTFARKLEKDFPLPWDISFYGDGVHYIETEGDSGFWIMADDDRDTRKHNDTPEGRDALEYMVRCANLMPEAVELLGKCAREIQNRCDFCAGSYGRACIGCSNSEMRTEIHALLAKLEGGAEDDRNNPRNN